MPTWASFWGSAASGRDTGSGPIPIHTRLDVSAGFGTEPGHVRGRLRFDFPVWGSVRGELRVLASGAEVRRFHGFGNDTRADRDEDFYDAEQTEVMAALPVGLTWGQGREFRVGPVVRHFSPRNAQGTLADSLRPGGVRLVHRSRGLGIVRLGRARPRW